MDNVSSTNKNFYTVAFCLELVQHKLDFFRESFMLAGHTKFSVDQVFSKISNTNRRSDVFTTAAVAGILLVCMQMLSLTMVNWFLTGEMP